jgi:hypothetical protein
MCVEEKDLKFAAGTVSAPSVYSRVILCGSGQFVGPLPFLINMSTAIAIVWNDGGFGIASDTLHCEEGSHRPISEDVQKLFPITLPNAKLAFALCGTTQLRGLKSGIEEVLFDFAIDAPEAFERVTEAREPDLLGFAKRVAADITERLARAVEMLSNPNSVTHMVIVGYYNGCPDYVEIKFTVSTAPDKTTRCEGRAWPLDRDKPTGCGSAIILEKLRAHDDDPLFAQYRPSASCGRVGIDRAVEIAMNTVRAHLNQTIRELDPETCAAIGGKIRVAKITLADGFSCFPESDYQANNSGISQT